MKTDFNEVKSKAYWDIQRQVGDQVYWKVQDQDYWQLHRQVRGSVRVQVQWKVNLPLREKLHEG